jgi:membrane protein DedA with SNARE-associated domain
VVELFEQIGVLIQQIIGTLGYPGVFAATLIENLFPPIPSELIMPFSGFLVGQGQMTFVGAVIAGTAGTVIGALIIYYIGWWADETLIRGFIRRYGRFIQVSESDLDRALGVFDRHGELIVFAGRLIPLIRTLISLPAGMRRMPMGKFLLYTTLGSAIWTALLTYAGVLLGANWESILGWMKVYEHIVIAVTAALIIALVVFVGVRFLRGRAAVEAVGTGD